jgi:hypothetical protein
MTGADHFPGFGSVVHYAHAFHTETWFSCIADYRLVLTRRIDSQVESGRLITALRLFRLGSVASS